jgi:hypothetical protein
VTTVAVKLPLRIDADIGHRWAAGPRDRFHHPAGARFADFFGDSGIAAIDALILARRR